MKLTFEKGLLGLELYKEYDLLDLEGFEPFKILQSKEEKDIGLVVVSPFEIREDYEFEISDSAVKSIEAENREDLLVLTTVNLDLDENKTTTNLRAPIVINKVCKKGVQIILNNEQYKIKHPISKG